MGRPVWVTQDPFGQLETSLQTQAIGWMGHQRSEDIQSGPVCKESMEVSI